MQISDRAAEWMAMGLFTGMMAIAIIMFFGSLVFRAPLLFQKQRRRGLVWN